jgi:hypothetical protein
VLHLAIEISEATETEPLSRVDLVSTDETGASDRVEIGAFDGVCKDTSALHRQDAMKPILSFDCAGWESSPGSSAPVAPVSKVVQFRFVHRGSELIVLRGRAFEEEEISFDEHTRIPLPSNVPIKTDSP